MMAVVADPPGQIVVVNDHAWIGDPRLGSFTVVIDGQRVGRVPLHGELRWPVAPGTHTVRIKQWSYYKSSRLTIQVPPGAPVILRANKPAAPVWSAMLRLMLRPFSSLSLEPDTRPSELARASAGLDAATTSRRRRALGTYGLVMLVFFVAALAVLKLVV